MSTSSFGASVETEREPLGDSASPRGHPSARPLPFASFTGAPSTSLLLAPPLLRLDWEGAFLRVLDFRGSVLSKSGFRLNHQF